MTLAARGRDVPSGDARSCHRIPALAADGRGHVVAAWDVRLDWRDLPGHIDIVLRRSGDAGRHWGAVDFLRRGTPQHGYGDASLTWHPSGVLVCCYVGSTGRSFFTADTGPKGSGLELWVATSADGGRRWTHRDVTNALKPADVTGMFFSSGNGIVLSHEPYAGRIVQPAVLRRDDAHWAAMAISDDVGRTWRLGQVIGPDCDENKVVELSDGRLLLHARSAPRRRQAFSGDGGETWSAPVAHPALVDPGCNGGLARCAGVLVASGLDDESSRRRLVVRTSRDEGSTWSDPLVVDPGAAGYSTIVELSDGCLGMLYERGDYASMDLCRISAQELGLAGDGAATLRPRPALAGAAKPPEVGSTPPAGPSVT